jgi:nucleoid-associated protein YgaU
MARETKIGLLVGLGVILLIGIIVSDHLSAVRRQDPATMIGFGPASQEGLNSENRARPPGETDASAVSTEGTTPAVPLPGEDDHSSMPDDNDNTPAPAADTHGTSTAQAPTNPNPLGRPGGATAVTPVAATPVVSSVAPLALATHTVQTGDTLSKIARKYYNNDQTKWTLIQAANADALGPQCQLKTGMKLTIPAPPRVETLVSAPTAHSPSIVTVQRGDTLGTLAARTMGDKNKWKALFDENHDQLKRETDLKVGMVLRVPSKAAVAANNTPVLSLTIDHSLAPTATPIRNASAPSTYTVKQGDTLSIIAARTLGDKNKWMKIYVANKSDMDSPTDLSIGQVIRIPANS